jgi:hypothetical protein
VAGKVTSTATSLSLAGRRRSIHPLRAPACEAGAAHGRRVARQPGEQRVRLLPIAVLELHLGQLVARAERQQPRAIVVGLGGDLGQLAAAPRSRRPSPHRGAP